MAATWEDMGARGNSPMHATALRSSPKPSCATQETNQCSSSRCSSSYECGAICRDAAVTAASLQTLQLHKVLS